MSDTQNNDKSNQKRKADEEELDIDQGMEVKEPNRYTTTPEQNLRQKAATMNNKSQESHEPA